LTKRFVFIVFIGRNKQNIKYTLNKHTFYLSWLW